MTHRVLTFPTRGPSTSEGVDATLERLVGLAHQAEAAGDDRAAEILVEGISRVLTFPTRAPLDPVTVRKLKALGLTDLSPGNIRALRAQLEAWRREDAVR